MSNNETLSLEIGTWAQAVSITDVPKHVQDQALLNILDAVGIAFASTHYEFATRSIAASVALGSGPRGVIACSERLTVRDQAMLNGILIHGLILMTPTFLVLSMPPQVRYQQRLLLLTIANLVETI